MHASGIIEQTKLVAQRRQRNILFFRLTLLESIITVAALALAAYFFVQLNSVTLPVSSSNGHIVSFEATQSIRMRDLLGTVIIIAVCSSAITAYIRKKFLYRIVSEN